MRRRLRHLIMAVVGTTVALLMSQVCLASFADDFESDPPGTFPSNWTHFTPENSEVVVIDESLDPGSVFAGEQSLSLTFLGGYGSGVATAFDPIEYGVLEFYARRSCE